MSIIVSYIDHFAFVWPLLYLKLVNTPIRNVMEQYTCVKEELTLFMRLEMYTTKTIQPWQDTV